MATFEQYENLPGVKVDYHDGNLYSGNEASLANTQSVLIIGTAIDGPVGEPVSVNAIGGPKAAEKMFGGLLERVKVVDNGEEKTIKVPHEGTLIRGMYEALRSGNEDVRLLRVSGKTAKSEVAVKDSNNEVTQALADASGDQLIPGNVAFSMGLDLPDSHRLLKIEKVEEFLGSNTSGTPIKTFTGNSGYEAIDDTVGSEQVFFGKDIFRPKSTVKVSYKASKRNYQEVTRSMNGVDDPSTLGVLTQDPSNTSYFSAEVGNWSDELIHQVNVYVVDSKGEPFNIPSTNTNGEKLYRIGEGDPAVGNELKDITTPVEFQQGGIRFTSAYQKEVAAGMYPALNSGVTVTADYFYYNDIEVARSVEKLVPGKEKTTFLNFIPVSDSLEVYYDNNGVKQALVEGDDFTVIYPSDSAQKVRVLVKSGVGPVGARLFASYKTGENSVNDAKLIINAKQAGALYGGLENDLITLHGVKYTVEYDLKANGSIDTENRVIRFIKPETKKNSSIDKELVFRTKELRGVKTLREFANYVNGLSGNNIVYLDVPVHAGEVPINGIVPTDYVVSSFTGVYEYRPINLGEAYNEASMKYALLVDSSKSEDDPARYPWLGDNGFFNVNNLLDMKRLYETLGGKYELVAGTLDEYKVVEQGIYSKLENYQVDVIDLKEVNANTAIGEYNDLGELVAVQDRNFATQLAQHCAMVTAKTWETIGVIGVAPSPYATLREVQDYVDVLTNRFELTNGVEQFYLQRGINPRFQNLHFMYNTATHELIYGDDREPIDIGRYINVVVGPEVGLSHETLGNYVTNGSTVYSALITSLNPEVATTNKQASPSGLRYNFSESQHNQLAGGRYVTFENRLNLNGTRTIVVKDGVTAAAPNSDYQRLSTVRITHATVQLIRQRANKFIGLPNGIAQRNSLATEIQASLDRLKELGVLQNFKFSIFSSAKDRVLGNAFITLELVPEFEMRKIYTSVTLRASL